MLKGLKLKNLALIEIIEINFEKGLNVFTGESGSGKSLILDSLNSLFGGTNIPINHLIRPGQKECLIEARFTCSKKIEDWLFENGYKCLKNEIIISRRTFKNKSKICTKFTVNSYKISKKLLRLLGIKLIDFAGQSDTFHFGSENYLRTIIDDLGSIDLDNINLLVKKNWSELNILKKEINIKTLQLEKEEENSFATENLLKILDKANLESKDEIIELKTKEFRLANNFDLSNSIKHTFSYLNSSAADVLSVNSLVYESIKELNKVSKYDQVIEKYIENLISIQNQTEELIHSLSEYLKMIDINDDSLESVQKRLFDLQNLEKTFSLELPDLIKKRDELRIKSDLSDKKKEIQILRNKYNDLNQRLIKLFSQQSSLRKKTAYELEKNVVSKLRNLGLENAIFKIDFQKVEPNGDGQDIIKFLFSANPDQQLAPISKVISGGEMSRFLLALKSSISIVPESLFLDEIDNGLSGKSLNSLIDLIKKISNNKQVLCITHQPLLVAASNNHFKVEKHLKNGKTFTLLTKLTTREQRQKELAQLIGVGFSESNKYALTLLNKEAA